MNQNLQSLERKKQEESFDVDVYALVRLSKKNVRETSKEAALEKALAKIRSEHSWLQSESGPEASSIPGPTALGITQVVWAEIHERGAALTTSKKLHLNEDGRWLSGKSPRVLVTVQGGVADFVADSGVEVAIFDQDDFSSDPNLTEKPPAHFADLAEFSGIPYRT